MTSLTMSKLSLNVLCSAWRTMDAPQTTSQAARKGTVFHAAVDAGALTCMPGVNDLSDADAAEVYEWLEAWNASPLSRVSWVHEQAMAYNPRTGNARLLTTKGRDYSGVSPDEIAGTDDLHRTLFHENGDMHVEVCDLKTGRQEHLEPAARHRQLRALLLTLCRALGANEGTVIVAHVTADGVREDRATLDAFDLLAVEDELRDTTKAPTDPRPGHHCRDLYCPAVAVCPATAATVQALVPAVEPFSLSESNDSQADALLARVKAVEEAAEQAKAIVKAYADKMGGFRLSTGKRWGPMTISKETITLNGPDGVEGQDIIVRAGAAGAIKSSVTKADLKRCIKDKAALADVLSKLRSAGCAREFEQVQYRTLGGKAEADE